MVNEGTRPPLPGELFWVDFSPTKGTEQAGRRPALVVSGEDYNRISGRALVMPISSRTRGWPTEIPLGSEQEIKGVVLADQVRVMDWKARPLRFAGQVSATVLELARDRLVGLIERE